MSQKPSREFRVRCVAGAKFSISFQLKLGGNKNGTLNHNLHQLYYR